MSGEEKKKDMLEMIKRKKGEEKQEKTKEIEEMNI